MIPEFPTSAQVFERAFDVPYPAGLEAIVDLLFGGDRNAE